MGEQEIQNAYLKEHRLFRDGESAVFACSRNPVIIESAHLYRGSIFYRVKAPSGAPYCTSFAEDELVKYNQ